MQFCKKLTDYREWNRTQHVETELNKRSLNSRHENGVFEKKVTQSLENNWRWTLLLQKRCKHRATIFWTLLAVYPMVCLRSQSGYFHSEKCKSQLARSTLGEAFAEALLSMFIQHLSRKLLSNTTMCLTTHLGASRCFRVLPKYVLIYIYYIMNIYIHSLCIYIYIYIMNIYIYTYSIYNEYIYICIYLMNIYNIMNMYIYIYTLIYI